MLQDILQRKIFLIQAYCTCLNQMLIFESLLIVSDMEILQKFNAQDIQHLSETNLKMKTTVAELTAENHALREKLRKAKKSLKVVSQSIESMLKK